MIHLCITPEREPKTRMMMEALAVGMGRRDCRILVGEPPDDEHPFVVWGQDWLTMRIVPEAYRQGRPFWTIDNGYWQPGRGTIRGYYRFCYRGMSPVLLPKTPDLRQPSVVLKPWRRDGRHVLLAMPGVHFGMALGIDVEGWVEWILPELRRHTDRPIRIRARDSREPLAADLAGAWALVTHSSNVAVDAAIGGIPVFVAPTSAAAPVGRTDLEIEEPVMPGRKGWLSSLASQHFTIQEMRSGIARTWMQRIAMQVDHEHGGRENRAA
jgi:hypothetical protein